MPSLQSSGRLTHSLPALDWLSVQNVRRFLDVICITQTKDNNLIIGSIGLTIQSMLVLYVNWVRLSTITTDTADTEPFFQLDIQYVCKSVIKLLFTFSVTLFISSLLCVWHSSQRWTTSWVTTVWNRSSIWPNVCPTHRSSGQSRASDRWSTRWLTHFISLLRLVLEQNENDLNEFEAKIDKVFNQICFKFNFKPKSYISRQIRFKCALNVD